MMFLAGQIRPGLDVRSSKGYILGMSRISELLIKGQLLPAVRWQEE